MSYARSLVLCGVHCGDPAVLEDLRTVNDARGQVQVVSMHAARLAAAQTERYEAEEGREAVAGVWVWSSAGMRRLHKIHAGIGPVHHDVETSSAVGEPPEIHRCAPRATATGEQPSHPMPGQS